MPWPARSWPAVKAQDGNRSKCLILSVANWAWTNWFPPQSNAAFAPATNVSIRPGDLNWQAPRTCPPAWPVLVRCGTGDRVMASGDAMHVRLERFQANRKRCEPACRLTPACHGRDWRRAWRGHPRLTLQPQPHSVSSHRATALAAPAWSLSPLLRHAPGGALGRAPWPPACDFPQAAKGADSRGKYKCLGTGNRFGPDEPRQQRHRARSAHLDADINAVINLGTFPRRQT